ncbi:MULTISPECIES: AraC family transcriptional regulator [Nocardiopsidaceae]|uniref:AraC family transcriptional regulator n=1 Tax=Streptomonospora nanhaiensis TaxID=1323731 RepID=A0ABY6YG41_9ACTN|nr:AraC family transcriptional regulator [Streptomonospora nanhaiensis]WAE71213.1 AraC family transcriptional regulator [Streptomonospora nanhaiensis]
MTDDQLSEVIDLVGIRGHVTGGFAVQGPWVSRASVDEAMKLIVMVHGRSRLTADGGEPIALGPGDVAILNDRSWLEVEGGAGDGPRREVVPDPDTLRLRTADADHDDVVIGIRVDLNRVGRELLLQTLPPVGHVRAADTQALRLRGALDLLLAEVVGGRPGAEFAIRQHGQLLVLEVLRAYLGRLELPPGWLRALADEQLRPALGLMHSAPGKPWRLEELARAAAMSRTSFTDRFRSLAGIPPLTYLSRWRMLLAQRALRDSDVRVGSLASELGYASEGAFSSAFRRQVGESPLHYRSRVRDAPSAGPEAP